MSEDQTKVVVEFSQETLRGAVASESRARELFNAIFDYSNGLPAQSHNPVKLRGEALHGVLWRGKQWAVTEYGVECLDGTYAANDRDISEDGPMHWALHLSGKVWCDVADVCAAFVAWDRLKGKP